MSKNNTTTNSSSNTLSGNSGDYTITSSGTNEARNHYCHRDHGTDAANQNSYHYSNTDGSYYYSNSDGSAYHNDGKGGATYTRPPGGKE
ncbi:uncharacterized protein EKO05_0002412 [Ascochyta rabiei]|uniref:Uncharacterized protein n=1 Tax=Didymella rabiei TaxID=5454 RepID=A0A162VNK4_DIDRA|nr:uncharacterized protein EKO05_0002412 [Ascochyta rabiei]KZM18549.1 hypothetical protein ST47_g10256 [Ascochyta rabiei]UPX11825.1 hypothetical protein EKO05_0002412 [Ascochyta rabiei]